MIKEGLEIDVAGGVQHQMKRTEWR